MNFNAKLLAASRKNKSLLCVGLDPDPTLMPSINVVDWGKQIIEATRDLVCAYKPNFAFYEALGVDGLSKLDQTLQAIPDHIPIIADAKLGDIGNTARKYAYAVFEVFSCDAVTVNPYLGFDAVQPFTDYADRGVFLLCHTSNEGAADFQKLRYRAEPSSRPIPLFEMVAMKALEWNVNRNIGLVVGATTPAPLKRVREICPDMPILIPGIGAQKGSLTAAVRNGIDASGQNAIITVSRQVTYASRGRDFSSAARLEASKIRTRITQLVTRK